MDQTNPLSEVTHKRRLSALGPGGLTRERAGFEVRDASDALRPHLPDRDAGRPNIGLISSAGDLRGVNSTASSRPYRKVVAGRVTDEVVYLSAMEEAGYTVGQANAEIDARGKFIAEAETSATKAAASHSRRPNRSTSSTCRPSSSSRSPRPDPVPRERRRQPRADGLNMQRQAVPLIRQIAAGRHRHGGGRGARLGRGHRAARRTGVVDQVDAMRIVVARPECRPQPARRRHLPTC